MVRAVTIALGLAIALASASAGQNPPTPEAMGLTYSINIGAALAVNDKMRHTTFPTVGVAYYDTAGENFGQMSMFGVTADWVPVERSDNKTVQLVPVMFNYRQYGFISSYRVFVTLGLGVLAVTDPIPEMQLENWANFGWTAGVGLDITNNLNIQGRFIGGQNPGNDGLASLTLGYRF